MRLPFTLSDESLTVFVEGKMRTVLSNTRNFDLLKEHLNCKVHDAKLVLKLSDREEYVRASTVGSKVTVVGGVVYYDGQVVYGALTDKLLNLLDQGYDVSPWTKFLENLMDNPSYRSRKCLFEFLDHFNAPLTAGGNFIAFKRVGRDWKDLHSGTYTNTIGALIKMDRSKVDDNPQHSCSSGLHVCADEYLEGYANGGYSRTLVVEVNPANVVAVPYDYNFSKMRVCEYRVLSEVDVEDIPDILSEEMYDYGEDYNDYGGH
jgi:hypothetical protein